MLYIGVTVSISVALSTCALFISLMQLVNGAEFLNITFSLILFALAPSVLPSVAVLLADIFTLTSLYESL